MPLDDFDIFWSVSQDWNLEDNRIVNLHEYFDPRQLAQLQCPSKTYFRNSALWPPSHCICEDRVDSIEENDPITEFISHGTGGEDGSFDSFVPLSHPGVKREPS